MAAQGMDLGPCEECEKPAVRIAGWIGSEGKEESAHLGQDCGREYQANAYASMQGVAMLHKGPCQQCNQKPVEIVATIPPVALQEIWKRQPDHPGITAHCRPCWNTYTAGLLATSPGRKPEHWTDREWTEWPRGTKAAER